MADYMLSQPRLSLIDLRQLGESLDLSLADAVQEQAMYQNQIAGILAAQRDLEATRLQLEAKLEQVRQDLDRATLDLMDAEAAESETAHRIEILRRVEEETRAIKARALEELKVSFARVPLRGAPLPPTLAPPASTSRLPSGRAVPYTRSTLGQPDPETEASLADDIRTALVRRPGSESDVGVDPNDMQSVREGIRALIRGQKRPQSGFSGRTRTTQYS